MVSLRQTESPLALAVGLSRDEPRSCQLTSLQVASAVASAMARGSRKAATGRHHGTFRKVSPAIKEQTRDSPRAYALASRPPTMNTQL